MTATYRGLIDMVGVSAGERTCLSREKELCGFFVNMGPVVGRCSRFHVDLVIRRVIKGLPVAKRTAQCLRAERRFDRWLRLRKENPKLYDILMLAEEGVDDATPGSKK